MGALNRLGLAAMSDAIAAGAFSPVDLLEDNLAAIAAVDGELRSFVAVAAVTARAEAEVAAAEIAGGRRRSPLHGIPYGLKDVFETRGISTTAQSRALAGNVPDHDCNARERLAAGGAVLAGKTATWEFAHGGPSWDVLFPPARNPWDLSRSPSGSSSGSAAAVAACLVPFALGTDTGGSIRAPAAACGCVGLKPTYGLVSTRGVLPNSFSQDHVGPITRSVEDAAIVLQALAGHDSRDSTTASRPAPDYRAALSSSIRGLRIGIPYAWFEEEAPASAEVMRAFSDALETFSDLGAVLVPVSLPSLLAYEDVKRIIAVVDLFSIHAQTLRTRPDLLGQNLRCRIVAGGLVRGEDYVQAHRMRQMLADAMQGVLDDVSLLLLPTAEPAGPLEPAPASILFSNPGWTAAFNVSGNPALAVPCGFSRNALPLSLQIVGRLFDEATVLRAGHLFETHRGARPLPAIAGHG